MVAAKTSSEPKPDLGTGRGREGERARELRGNFPATQEIDFYRKCSGGYKSI